ncbi:MAG: helix-turn-helix domain-containing protein [Candidatus Micrarchaeota archaeon]
MTSKPAKSVEEAKPSAKLVLAQKSLDSLILPAESLAALSPDRFRILECLGSEAKYPAQVARELKLQVQTVYYHFRILSQAGLLRPEGSARERAENALRGKEKRFRAASDALSLVVNASWRPLHHPLGRPPSFLSPFLSGGRIDAKLVLGSPDAHGKFRGRGSEYCAVELGAWLGGFATFDYPLFLLDTEVREADRKRNLFLLGGPRVNTLVEEVNASLPVRFEEKTFGVESRLSGRKYGENVGFLEIADSPLGRGRKIFVIAGSNHIATRVAVLALVKESRRVEEGNLFDRGVIAKVVQGFDEDGDGIVDAVEFLE